MCCSDTVLYADHPPDWQKRRREQVKTMALLFQPPHSYTSQSTAQERVSQEAALRASASSLSFRESTSCEYALSQCMMPPLLAWTCMVAARPTQHVSLL